MSDWKACGYERVRLWERNRKKRKEIVFKKKYLHFRKVSINILDISKKSFRIFWEIFMKLNFFQILFSYFAFSLPVTLSYSLRFTIFPLIRFRIREWVYKKFKLFKNFFSKFLIISLKKISSQIFSKMFLNMIKNIRLLNFSEFHSIRYLIRTLL